MILGGGNGGNSMESRMNRPFIIRGKKEETVLPADDPMFDQSVETKFILIYESVKQFYYVFYYEGKCSDYSKVMIYYMLANVFWVIVSFLGTWLIRSKEAKKIIIFFGLLIVAFLSRIGIYFIMYNTMNFYISKETLEDCQCKAIYVDDLYMIQAIFEAVILLIMTVFVKIIHKYVQDWENKKTAFLFGQSSENNSRILRPNRKF